jgi:hypothetical protein
MKLGIGVLYSQLLSKRDIRDSGLGESLIQLVPAVYTFRTVLVDLGTENFVLGESLYR